MTSHQVCSPFSEGPSPCQATCAKGSFEHLAPLDLEILGVADTPHHVHQSDFSCLPGAVGLEWAEALGHRHLFAPKVPSFTLLRFRQGEYGAEQKDDGSVETGGLQQEMVRMDRALAELFPVSIHVVHGSTVVRPSYRVAEPHWKGSIHVHPVPLKALTCDEAIGTLGKLVREIAPDLVHLHHPNNRLDSRFLTLLPPSIGLVASYHGAPPEKIDRAVLASVKFSYLQKLSIRFSAHRESHSVPAAAYHTALDACAYVSKILLDRNYQRSGITRKITSQVAKTGHGIYHAYNLSAVSRAGQRAFEDLPSIIMHPPGDATFFSRDLITENQMRDIREEIGSLDDRPILSYHARISAMKGQAFLPQVIAQLKAIYSQPFSLVIVGPESESGALQVLNREIQRFGVRDSVAVVGGRSQDFIRGLLGVSSVCVFPTFCEGLGLTAVEAQLMEVPVVAHKVGGVSDVVREGVTGRLIKPGDARGFAEAIAGLLDSPQLRSEYGSAGRQLMKRDFSPHGLAAYAMQRLYLPQLLNCGRAAL